MKKQSLLLVLVVLPFAAFRLAAGCGAQGEGELCSTLNNNDDCSQGLTCQMIPGQGYSACCPPNGGSTNPACMGAANAGGSRTTGSTGGSGGAGGASSSTSGTSTSSSASGVSTSSSTSGTSTSSSTSGTSTSSSSSGTMGTGGMSSTDGGTDGG